MSYTAPRISTRDSTLLPEAPSGWMFANITTVDGNTADLANYPVLLFGPYTYTALTPTTNTESLLIISFDATLQTVTFTGQLGLFVVATLDELIIGPSIVYLPSTSGPKLPYTLSYAAPPNGPFPVLRSGPYSFWPASYADKRNSFCVVVVDQNNVILKLIDCPGSQAINEVVVDDTLHVIELIGADGVAVNFPWNTAMACFSCRYDCTKDDFLFLAQYFDVPLSDADAAALAPAMPQIDSSLCCRMQGTYTDSLDLVKRDGPTGLIIGSLLGSIIGAIGGFFIGGPPGAVVGLSVGYAIGGAIGGSIPSSSDKGQYALSSLEKLNSLVGYVAYTTFPCGPFDNAGIGENVFDAPFPRYAELPYSGAITKPGAGSAPQAYSPATQAIGDFPRDPRYNPLTLTNGIQVTKYIFVIIQTDETVNGNPGYQMRINPEDFYPDSWPANQRVNHSQLSEGYRFWALVGHPHMQVYAAGSLYVDITNKKLLGIDTRTGHYFRSFQGQDQAVNDATFGFLSNLGYDTSSMKNYIDIIGYFQQYQG
ncbi:hypothetical protein GSI_14924 [Ganoderma sinense ZZ0214-1]|uniref:Uncharacterized protein n=1 Tax=Ganoderma sinense ZZ0214-1 TaxID=1077348 RepID=A0A2G8RQ40_9APHY|nr:hypothetical protein GSI_14924 [Ganoderma sinense ZZ0214-1]